MYPTAEIRWFFQGPIPLEVEAWFQQGAGSVEREPPRTDRYLRLPGSDDLNVKLREGHLEIKLRVGQVNTLRLHEHVSGVVERWHKWSFELAEPAGARTETMSAAGSWIAVRKERRLRTYQVKRGGRVVALTSSEPPAEGCELELSTIDAAGQTWWTLAFEAFGDESALPDNLVLVAKQVLSVRDEPPPFPTDASQGYAAWLNNLDGAEARS